MLQSQGESLRFETHTDRFHSLITLTNSNSESSESITIQSLDLVANLVSFLDQDLVEDAIEVYVHVDLL